MRPYLTAGDPARWFTARPACAPPYPGMNAIFGLRISIAIGDTFVLAIAVGTAVRGDAADAGIGRFRDACTTAWH